MMDTDFPGGWVKCALSDIAGLQNGFAFKSRNYVDDGHFLIRIGNVQDAGVELNRPVYVDLSDPKTASFELNEGDILMSLTGNVGRVATIQREHLPAALNQRVARLFPLSTDGLHTRFLIYLLKNPEYLEQLFASAKGAAQQNISGKEVLGASVWLPPLAEQTRIANKLDELLAQVDTIKVRVDAIPGILKRFRQSVLAAAVSGRLTEEWRAQKEISETTGDLAGRIASERSRRWDIECERVGRKRKYKLPVEGESADLPGIPGGWKWMSVDALSTKVVDGVHKKPVYQGSGVPFVTVKNLTAGPGISFVNLNYVSERDHQEFFKRTNPERGDILISKDGTLGVVRQVKTDKVFSIFVSVALVKPVLSEMSDFLEIAFSSPVLQNQMVGVGTGLQHIHLTDLRKDMVPVPPMEEQAEIVRIARNMLEMSGQVERRLAAAQSGVESLTQSILAKAFRGELVPQNPDDEPASVMLRRIQSSGLESFSKSARR